MMNLINAVIKLEVPDYQIGQPVTIYFKDTMRKFAICDREQTPVKPGRTVNNHGFHYDYCGVCDKLLPVDSEYGKASFCPACGTPVDWT
jgi:uncharacterized CHY-type Zn-finger protein